jgi:serine/threonine-protein kinase
MTSDTFQGGDPRIGTVLRGKYRLDRVIGRGGMAVVYKATHRNHAEFAVKMLHPELSIVEDVRSRFVREGYAANAVKHPGAVLVVDDDVAEDGAAFLVMELLDGLAGDQLWGAVGSRVPIEVASAITIQLLDVLAAAHAKGIIHRDIKPANLFLTRDGTVKVLDFGIARAREAIVGAQATGSAMTLGTPAFMAPEHARGRSREMDGRTDLWSVGATFFAMVSGELVHTGETSNEFLIAAGTHPARSLASVAPETARAFVEVIDRALAFAKGDRWPTAAAMRGALLEVHRAMFGGVDVEAVVAAAVKAHVPPPERVASYDSPAAETKTSAPSTSRPRTERLSTSAAIARDRDSLGPRSSRVALGLGALALVALVA